MTWPPGRVRPAWGTRTRLSNDGGDNAWQRQRCHTVAMVVVSVAAAAVIILAFSVQLANSGTWSMSPSTVELLRSPPQRNRLDYDGGGITATGTTSNTVKLRERPGLPPASKDDSERWGEEGIRGGGTAAERGLDGGVHGTEGMRQLPPLQERRRGQIVPSAGMAPRRLVEEVQEAGQEEAADGDQIKAAAAADNNGEEENNADDLRHNGGVFGSPRVAMVTQNGDGGQWGARGNQELIMRRPANNTQQQDDGGKHWYPAVANDVPTGSPEMFRKLQVLFRPRISGEGEGGKLLDNRDRCFHGSDGRHRCYPTVFFFGTSKCGEFNFTCKFQFPPLHFLGEFLTP